MAKFGYLLLISFVSLGDQLLSISENKASVSEGRVTANSFAATWRARSISFPEGQRRAAALETTQKSMKAFRLAGLSRYSRRVFSGIEHDCMLAAGIRSLPHKVRCTSISRPTSLAAVNLISFTD